jgi:3-oxoadipate enol-lactonase
MKATINGLGMEFQTEGPRTGLPVVFLHGFPFSRAMWAPQIAAVSGTCYCVSYDIRGHGSSDVGNGQYSVEYFVDDLVGLLDHLKISRAVLVGLSMGGYIALRAAERHPNRVRGLVLADTRSEADGNEGKIKRAQQARIVQTEGMRPFAEPFLAGLFHEQTFRTKPEVVAMIRDVILATSPTAVAGTLLALAARTDSTPSLFTLRVPTLILVGQQDALTPPSASHAMKEKIPNAEIHVLPKAGHLSNLENPELFNEYLSAFLARVP